MKRVLISGLIMAMATLGIAPLASAMSQTNFQDLAADSNGDGTVTFLELWQYNNDARGS